MNRNISFEPNGSYKFYYDDNITLKSEGTFNNGVLDGTFIYYYPNSNKMYELTLKNGIKSGDCYIYNNQGILATKITYVDDVVTYIGLYYPNALSDGTLVATLYSEYNMNGSSLDGAFRDLTKRGIPRRLGEYKDSSYYNYLKMYYENTSLLIFEDTYNGSSLSNKKTYDRVGRLLNDIDYSGVSKISALQYYYTDNIYNKTIEYKFINNDVEIVQLR